ncbi:TPA: transposase [Klebsiella pneumoniae]|nr:transposase [Klebsiella pneumoniae]
MKSLTAVRKKSPNYPVEFKIKMVELSHRPEISVAQLAREHGINDNLLFKWRQYWREGKLRPPSTTENNVPELLPIRGHLRKRKKSYAKTQRADVAVGISPRLLWSYCARGNRRSG